ncbi:hypothetical protein DEJ51_28910 [Streptomyces venezuelae]|uniref:Uncharacterized protein n=1 Tax=Streptomyces venezuelae TaxID=54571 RepID=A0A5P2DYK0_STRVZ|nr:hypothetical protein [Streptomyces venezuelae]QES57699.1 hypothetical protein DEJ51_28910 [Streptomyces venezuelae]
MDKNTATQLPAPGLPAPGLSTTGLFDHCLTDEGLAWLWALLDSGRYEVRAPEEAALLCFAWLVRAGETGAAAALVEEIRPFAGEVRFAPHPADQPVPGADDVHVRTVGEVAAALARRGPRPGIEAQHEALTVWRPFEDELLDHWLRAGAATGQDSGEGAALLARYRRLAAAHTRCTKHLDPKSNPAVLRRALEERVAGRELTPRLAGLLRHAVASMVARRGRPGSPEHTRLRRDQARQADRPAHHDLAALVLRRLAPLDASRGLADVGPLIGPVTAEEAGESGLPAGTVVPASVRAAVTAARSAPLDTLLEHGLIPSAEVLGEVAEQLVAAHTARGYADASLRTLMAATYRARRGRRYPLWWTPEHHERITGLPWVRAVAPWAADPVEQARSTLRMLGEACVRAFPGAGLPNLPVRALSGLARLAEVPVPFAAEPLADPYGGTADPAALAAARTAAGLLRGTVYERYHGIDYAAVRGLTDAQDGAGFARLCAERAGRAGVTGLPGRTGPLPVSDAAVVEQARILTTSNLATLVVHAGVTPRGGWDGVARGAFAAATGPAATGKSTACAWRQLLFHLALCDADEQARVLTWIEAEAARLPARAAARIAERLAGLRLAAAAVR